VGGDEFGDDGQAEAGTPGGMGGGGFGLPEPFEGVSGLVRAHARPVIGREHGGAVTIDERDCGDGVGVGVVADIREQVVQDLVEPEPVEAGA